MDTPDERSVMTYVAEFFHKFSSEGESISGEFSDGRQGGDWSTTYREVCRSLAGSMVSKRGHRVWD